MVAVLQEVLISQIDAELQPVSSKEPLIANSEKRFLSETGLR